MTLLVLCLATVLPKYCVFEATRHSIPRELSCQSDLPKIAKAKREKESRSQNMVKSKIDKGRALGIMGFFRNSNSLIRGEILVMYFIFSLVS